MCKDSARQDFSLMQGPGVRVVFRSLSMRISISGLSSNHAHAYFSNSLSVISQMILAIDDRVIDII